jgi:hypothetical protein
VDRHPTRRMNRQIIYLYLSRAIKEVKLLQSQSHITTDSQSASLSWCRTPSGAHDQKLDVLNLGSYSPVYVGALSDERFGLSFVIVSH